MNKKNIFIIVLTIILLISLTSFLTITIHKNYNKKYDIQQTNQSWTSYDNSINNIKANMDPITEPNENFFWWALKEFDIQDDEYERVLNLLVADVRMCYLDYTDDGTLYTNSNPIRQYRNKKYITKKELETLNFLMYHDNKLGCLKNFDRYSTLLISNDEELKNKVINITNKITLIKQNELFTNENASYNELLLKKTIEVHLIEDISEFLVHEYNRLK